MQMTLKIQVGLIALLMAFMGLNVMLNAADAAQQFGVTPEGIAGLSTLRGDIGGMFVTSTVLLALGLWRGQTTYFLAVAILMGLIALGRLIGFAMDGVTQAVVVPFVFELVFVVVLVAAHYKLAPDGGSVGLKPGFGVCLVFFSGRFWGAYADLSDSRSKQLKNCSISSLPGVTSTPGSVKD